MTDYDVWHESHETVTVEAVIQNLLRNVATAKDVLRRVIPAVGGATDLRVPGAARATRSSPAGGVPARPPVVDSTSCSASTSRVDKKPKKAAA